VAGQFLLVTNTSFAGALPDRLRVEGVT